MANLFTLVLTIAILISCFHIECISSLAPRLDRARLSRRSVAPLNIEEAIKILVSGAKGAGAVVQHTGKGELQLMKAKEASVPGSASKSEFGTSTADLGPSGSKKTR